MSLKAISTVKIEDESGNLISEAHGSPTSELIEDILRDIGTDETRLRKITHFVTVGTDGIDKDSGTVSCMLDTTSAKATFSATFTAQHTYTCDQVKLTANGKTYFVYTLSPKPQITYGKTYRLTYEVQLIISLTSSSPTATLDTANTSLHVELIKQIGLGVGDHKAITISELFLYSGDTLVARRSITSKSYSAAPRKATLTYSWTQATTISFNRCVIRVEGYVIVNFVGITYTTTQTITAGTPCTFTFEFTM